MGKRIYLNNKDMELLEDLLMNDVSFTEADERVEEKEEVIIKVLRSGKND